MTVQETMARLEALSDDKVRRYNIRNGVGDNQFGVKSGDLRALAKEIRTDAELAKQLWATQNLDARMLAALVTKAKSLSIDELETMVTEADNAQLADWLNSYVVKAHPSKEELRLKWMDSDDAWLSRSAWSLTTDRVAKDPGGIDMSHLLDRIEKEMAGAEEPARWTMNFCLASIGIHHSEHRQRALQIGEAVGAYRDYPVSKGCTSPYAPIWINEMVSRRSG